MNPQRVDVAVIGGGPVGSLAALAFAQKGARVALLEAHPDAAGRRLAGEWLHPPAVETLIRLGVPLPAGHRPGRGFVLFPDDGTEPHVLPYAGETRGLSVEHGVLVRAVRDAAVGHAGVTWLPGARVTGITGQQVTYAQRGERALQADLIVGADGRSSVARKALGAEGATTTCSRMAGLLLHGVSMPHEDHGHVFLGGPGPVLAYRVGPEHVRLCIDVPPGAARRDATWLWAAFGPVLPAAWRAAFREALAARAITWAANQVRPRTEYGREGLVLVGDAIGHYHPLTALGMTLGFGDALTLAEGTRFSTWRRARVRETRVPELLAVALYEVFADASDETVAIRRAVYDLWRTDDAERRRTMGYLACQDRRTMAFARSFLKAVRRAAVDVVSDGLQRRAPSHAARVARALGGRIGWLFAGVTHLRAPSHTYEGAVNAQSPGAEVMPLPRAVDPTAPARALDAGVRALVAAQHPDGRWEGEVVWNAMLPAQYVLACRILDVEIEPERRARLLTQFRCTQLPSGTWGMHPQSEPYLFTTTLVYVAARLLGVPAEDPLLARAGRFIRAEDVTTIPSWGRFWLAMVGLYEWTGVHAVLPEVWALPRSLPAHPAHFYCHTRLIYLGMAVIYARRPVPRHDALLEALRAELYPQGYEEADFVSARRRMRRAELHTPHNLPLRAIFRLSRFVQERHDPVKRARLVTELRERIRWEMRSSSHTCISPVSGMLDVIALGLSDPDAAKTFGRLQDWMWEDDREGTRIAGARSGSWDTAFALQALAVAEHPDAAEAVRRGTEWLKGEQIREAPFGWMENDRIDPRGGWCFAGVWHGWPVSDCTAEALLALSANDELDREAGARAVDFILRCQDPDGGFGSYEARRTRVNLELANPAEMFGDSMTEHPYAECTASCVAALAAWRARAGSTPEIDQAIERGARRLRLLQRPDGAWAGNWGVHYTYGTMFGIHGLIAAGTPVTDPAIRRASRWLLRNQRPDGGWGELAGGEPAEESNATQTAWALSALLEAGEPDLDALDRAAACLADLQQDGEWPEQWMTGVFFHTALLDYRLYRTYFPVWALARYARHRAALHLTETREERIREAR